MTPAISGSWPRGRRSRDPSRGRRTHGGLPRAGRRTRRPIASSRRVLPGGSGVLDVSPRHDGPRSASSVDGTDAQHPRHRAGHVDDRATARPAGGAAVEVDGDGVAELRRRPRRRSWPAAGRSGSRWSRPSVRRRAAARWPPGAAASGARPCRWCHRGPTPATARRGRPAVSAPGQNASTRSRAGRWTGRGQAVEGARVADQHRRRACRGRGPWRRAARATRRRAKASQPRP